MGEPLPLFFFESTYIKQIISNGPSKPHYGVSRFIDDLCVINDGCKFAASFKNIYHKELELKIKHQGIYASFLDFDIKIKDSIFLQKLFGKRDKVPFFIVQMPDMSSNILSSFFYGPIFSEFFYIANCALRINDFIPRASDLFSRLIKQLKT